MCANGWFSKDTPLAVGEKVEEKANEVIRTFVGCRFCPGQAQVALDSLHPKLRRERREEEASWLGLEQAGTGPCLFP